MYKRVAFMSAAPTPTATPPANGVKGHDRLLTINDVAEWLGVSKAWVYDHATRKRPFLPCVRFGELTRFRRDEIEQFIRKHAKANGSA